MAWWVLVLSIAARRYSLPRALEIVAGRQSDRPVLTDPNAWERFARAIDLLLSADVWVFKPICWKRAAVLHRYLGRNGTLTRIILAYETTGPEQSLGTRGSRLKGNQFSKPRRLNMWRPTDSLQTSRSEE